MSLMRWSVRGWVVLGLVLAVVPAMARHGLGQSTGPVAHGTLEIVSGTWRVSNEADVDVTATLQGMVKDGQLSTKVGAAALGAPAPGKGRTGNLAITYKINGGEAQTKTVRGGGTQLTLTAPGAEGTAVEADAGDAGVKVLKGHTDGVMSLAFSPDSKMLASGGVDKSVILWDVASGKQSKQLPADAAVYSISFSPDGKHVAWGTAGHTISTYDLGLEKTDGVHEQMCPVVSMAFLPDSKHFVSCCGENLRVWDQQTEENVAVYEGDGQFHSLVVSTTGKVVTVDLIANLIEWDPKTGRKIAHHERPRANTAKGNVNNYPTGMVAGTDDHILVSDVTGVWDWDLASDKITLAANKVFQVAGVSADGKRYFGHNSDASIWVRDAGPTGSFLMPKVPAPMNTMTLSPDGSVLAMCAETCWDLMNRRPMRGPFDIRVQEVAPLEKRLAAETVREESGGRGARGQPRPGYTAVKPDETGMIEWK